MATPLDCYSLRYEFSLAQLTVKQEIAEFYLWFDGDGAEFGDSELPHLAEGGYKAWANNVNGNSFSTGLTLEGVTATSYLANGHTLHQGKATSDPKWVGAATDASLPWECSLAISLYCYHRGSFEPNARTKRGRFYLPPFTAGRLAANNSGFVDNADIADIGDQMHDFLAAAGQTDVGVPTGILSVFSRKAGSLSHVLEINLDAKIDSQRRRQNRETAGVLSIDFP